MFVYTILTNTCQKFWIGPVGSYGTVIMAATWAIGASLTVKLTSSNHSPAETVTRGVRFQTETIIIYYYSRQTVIIMTVKSFLFTRKHKYGLRRSLTLKSLKSESWFFVIVFSKRHDVGNSVLLAVALCKVQSPSAHLCHLNTITHIWQDFKAKLLLLLGGNKRILL